MLITAKRCPWLRNEVDGFLINGKEKDTVFSMTTIHYVLGDEELLDSVKSLWQELNTLHLERSSFFRDFYAGMTFEARKESLLTAARRGRLCTVLALDAEKPVGYCIASALADAGEIDSLYVSAAYRRRGIAGSLMDKALDWLSQSGAQKIGIKVSAGNEEVFGFYARYGFHPCLTELRRAAEV